MRDVAPEDGLAEAERLARLHAEYNRQARALTSLLESDGWALVDTFLKQIEDNHAQLILSGSMKGEDLDRALGHYSAVKQLRQWPLNQAKQLKPYAK